MLGFDHWLCELWLLLIVELLFSGSLSTGFGGDDFVCVLH
jgi:hypothetical protein